MFERTNFCSMAQTFSITIPISTPILDSGSLRGLEIIVSQSRQIDPEPQEEFRFREDNPGCQRIAARPARGANHLARICPMSLVGHRLAKRCSPSAFPGDN